MQLQDQGPRFRQARGSADDGDDDDAAASATDKVDGAVQSGPRPRKRRAACQEASSEVSRASKPKAVKGIGMGPGTIASGMAAASATGRTKSELNTSEKCNLEAAHVFAAIEQGDWPRATSTILRRVLAKIEARLSGELQAVYGADLASNRGCSLVGPDAGGVGEFQIRNCDG